MQDKKRDHVIIHSDAALVIKHYKEMIRQSLQMERMLEREINKFIQEEGIDMVLKIYTGS